MSSTSIYFFLYSPRAKREDPTDVDFVVPEKNEEKPKCIYKEEKLINKTYYYKKVFKVNKLDPNAQNKDYYFELETDDDKYIISFEDKKNTFYYEKTVHVGKKILKKILRKVNQNNVENTEKFIHFEKALKENQEEGKIHELYKETIGLYKKRKGFPFLITLFVKIYEKIISEKKDEFKELFPLLFTNFRKMNEEDDPKVKEKNIGGKPYLKDLYHKFFKDLIYIPESEEESKPDTKAEKLLKENKKYDPIGFYGIILCYLNYYDSDNFSKLIKNLFGNEKRRDNLFEILLIYYAHLKTPLDVDFVFFNEFIKYSLGKEFTIFERAIKYIRDYETYIKVIENNKEDFYEKYLKSNKNAKKHILILDEDLELKKNEGSIEKERVEESKNKKKVKEKEFIKP